MTRGTIAHMQETQYETTPHSPHASQPLSVAELLEATRRELGKQIVGQGELVERLLVALLCDGHVLLEGVPGLAKTRTLCALTQCIDVRMGRIQFTPDLLPSDLVGTEIYRPQSGDFITRQGPIFTNLLLADEINRAPAKVQSALLQAMQERQVTIGEQTFSLPEPFMVLATQNPIEQEGTYPLPEAQLDRFLMKLKVSYPSETEELAVLRLVRDEGRTPASLSRVLNKSDLQRARQALHNVYIDERIERYVVALVRASRESSITGLKGLIQWGASPRASIALIACARALALLHAKDFVSPDEVKAVAADVLRHRILPSFEAESRGVDADQIIAVLLKGVATP
jgi:MoxR-like ATPase